MSANTPARTTATLPPVDHDRKIQVYTGVAPGATHDRYGTRLPMIGTSDRGMFKRCRRKWNWNSPLRENLEPVGVTIDAFWLGTAVHYALEMYHGHNPHGSALAGLAAYCGAFVGDERPASWRDLAMQGYHMLDYYERLWLPRRDEFQTVWVDGQPQCEVNFHIPLPGMNAYYRGVFDRVVQDTFGRYWVLDYKTAKKHDTAKLPTDQQVTAYSWAATQIYGVQFEGVVYIQMLKTPPAAPKLLKNGKFSQAKTQITTHSLYTQALREAFGEIPEEYADYVHWLSSQEGAEGDLFIRRDLVRRNQHQLRAEGLKIVQEASEMLNPDLPLYPNPTYSCAFDCSFREPCIAMDDGSDAEWMIKSSYRPKRELIDWRSRIGTPEYPPIVWDSLLVDDERGAEITDWLMDGIGELQTERVSFY